MSTRVDPLLLMIALAEDDPDKAREQWLKACHLDDGEDLSRCRRPEEFDEQGVHDLLLNRVRDAILGERDTVVVERELAEAALLLVKKGIKRSRGGQRRSRSQQISLDALVGAARSRKEELVGGGLSATEAHHRAAEEIAEEMAKRGVTVEPGYLSRLMANARPKRKTPR